MKKAFSNPNAFNHNRLQTTNHPNQNQNFKNIKEQQTQSKKQELKKQARSRK